MSSSGPTSWKTYEEVACDLLERIGDHLGLNYVEGKQKLVGQDTEWEIDAKGVLKDGRGIVVIECRRYTTSRINQKDMGALAFTIKDLGASGGILVSPMEPQRGARQIAEGNGIQHLQLNSDATSTDYVLMVGFLNRAFIGVSDTITVTDTAWVTVKKEADEN
ncbi:hypothetical protein DVG80_21030 [Rhodococcus erythropolis]|nr:hypothetical protein DVG80_21030 [Rhodococcus erythropolis]